MSGRVNPFADLRENVPVFEPKRKSAAPVAEETIDRIAEDNNFLSRQPPPKVPKEVRRKRRLYTTGRNRQFNIKVSSETLDRFYAMADKRDVSLCKLLELALDALDRAGDSTSA